MNNIVFAKNPSASIQPAEQPWCDLQDADKEHAALMEIIKSYGREILMLPRENETTLDSVYTHEPALFLKSGESVILNPPTRRSEAPAMLKSLNSLSWNIIGYLSPDAHCDGGDLLWIDEQTLVAGRTAFTNQKAVEELQNILQVFGIQVVEVHLGIQTFHLHSIVSLLDKDLAVGFKDQLPMPLLELFETKKIKLIEVSSKS